MNFFRNISFKSFKKLGDSYFYLLILLLFLLPLYKISSSPFLILFSIIIVTNLLTKGYKMFENYTTKPVNYMFLAIFIIASFSLIYSQNLAHGLEQINKFLPFIIFPLMFSLIKLTKAQFYILLKSFIIGCLVAFVISISNQLIHVIKVEEYSFYYMSLIDILWMHPTYLSMYLNFAIVLTYILFVEKQFSLLILIFNTSIFILFILLLSARMQVLIMFLVLFVIFIHALRKKITFRTISISLILLSFMLIFITNNENLNNRFKYLKNLDYEYGNLDSKSWNGANVRLAIWNSTYDVIRENRWFGVGIGDEDDKLLESFKNNKFEFAYIHKYVVHNQFLQMFLSLGIFGFSIYLLLFVYLFYLSFKHKSFLVFTLSCILFLTGISESFLRMQSGIVFFTLMICIIVYNFSLIGNEKV